MKNGYYFVYRLLGIVVNMYAYVALFACLISLFYGGSNWMILIATFLSACLVIYSTLGGRFGILVLMLKKPIRYSLKEWIYVNAYISIAVYGLLLLLIVSALTNQAQIVEYFKRHPEMTSKDGETITSTQFMAVLKLLLVISLMVVSHCIWTLRLVRRFRDFFQ